MMTVDQVQERIIEEFSVSDDWMDKYDVLIEMGKDLSCHRPAA